jgi:hypothetical protein
VKRDQVLKKMLKTPPCPHLKDKMSQSDEEVCKEQTKSDISDRKSLADHARLKLIRLHLTQLFYQKDSEQFRKRSRRRLASQIQMLKNSGSFVFPR